MATPEYIPADKKTAPTQDTATPENTPVPGGGSWRWDIALPGWVENLPAETETPLE